MSPSIFLRRPAVLSLLLLLAFVLSACDSRNLDRGSGDDEDAEDDENADSDGDGLTDGFEAEIGTDPDDSDSDGDGFSDAEEHLAYFDANDASDWPYTGDYPRLALPESVSSSGQGMGQVPSNFGGPDQFGQDLELHRFYGNVVLVDIGAMWCGPCQQAAPVAEMHYQQYKDEGFVVLGVLIEDQSYESMSVQEQELWAEYFELNYPVLGDYNFGVSMMQGVQSNGLPTFVVLDRELRVQYGQNGFGGSGVENAIEALLADPFPEVDWPLPDNADELREDLDIEVLD